VTGPTARAMIAKLITERPTSLQLVRDVVPQSLDDAVMQALASIPLGEGVGRFEEVIRQVDRALGPGEAS
jgi:hypothetical protein